MNKGRAPNANKGLWLLGFLIVSGALGAPIELTAPDAGRARTTALGQARANESFARLPLMFESANKSTFLCRGSGYCLSLSPTDALLTLNPAPALEHGLRTPATLRPQLPAASAVNSRHAPAWLRIQLAGANSDLRAFGEEPLPTRVNYLLGNDPAQWRREVPTFAKVRYPDVYPGVDLIYYGNQRQLEYDFVVAPGANPEKIAMRLQGSDKIEIDADGDLILHMAGADLRQRKPRVYQEMNGRRREIEARYVFRKSGGQLSDPGERVVGFEIGSYDRSRPLVIDPVLVFSTFLGGLGLDVGWAIAVDSNGCVYVAGETASTNFVATNASSASYGGGFRDVFVAKLGAAGTNLVFSTYLGGSDEDAAFGIALDNSGNIFLAGLTASTNFPVTPYAISTNIHGAPAFGYYAYDAFVAELNTNGTKLLYSTYLGGSQADVANAIAVDGNGLIYVAGATASPDFPTNGTSAFFGGGNDAFVVKLDSASAKLVYSALLGGAGNDYALGLGVDSTANAVVAGLTASPNFLLFPITNALQTNFGGGPYDGFVAKLDPDGVTLFSTYLGGSGDDEISRLALDAAGNIYLTGLTTSTNFPTPVDALYPTNTGGADAFVLELDPTGTNLVYSTYLGGASNDQGWDIAVDANGSAYVIGLSASTNFPTTNAFQSALAGPDDVFVAKLNPGGTALDYATFLGGGGSERGYAIAVDNTGNAYITGTTTPFDFPVWPATNGVQSVYGGGTGDAFVAKLFPRNAELRASRGAGTGSNDVTILWPYGLPAFGLESTDDLAGTNTIWMTVTNAASVVGNDNAVTFTNSTGSLYLRLRRTQ